MGKAARSMEERSRKRERERDEAELKDRCCPDIDSDLLTSCLPDAFSSFLPPAQK